MSNITAFVVHQLTRIESMALASRHCDYFILTCKYLVSWLILDKKPQLLTRLASGSTFGWWTSYLMRNQSNVYYNSRFFKPNATEAQDFRENDFIPPQWKKLAIHES